MQSSSVSIEEALKTFPFWAHLTPEEKARVQSQAFIKEFTKNQIIASSDTSCMGVVLILKGGIRVSLISEEGREITLYRIEKGESCVTTASCVIRQITFDTVVSAVQTTKLLVIPSVVCSQLAKSNIYVKAFMYETETERFSQAIWVFQQMLFRRFDQRLAEYLINAYEESGSPDLKMTQEEIARNVNSAREVVARMLRQFVLEGYVTVKRGHIILRDPENLKKLL